MRRIVGVIAAVVMTVGIAGIVPASATHCNPGDLVGCTNAYPINVAIVEGVGNVCSAVANSQIKSNDIRVGSKTFSWTQAHGISLDFSRYPRNECKFYMGDPTWTNKAVSTWNPSPDQGLYWPGIGPGGHGPSALSIAGGTPAPPSNVCVSNVGGTGCSVHAQVLLDSGDSLQAIAPTLQAQNKALNDQAQAAGLPRNLPEGANTGAHCGSSHGRVQISFVAGDGSLETYAWLEWTQSAATILPEFGEVVLTVDRAANPDRVIESPSGNRPTLISFVSSRGVGAAGNCGITSATTNFQVEGFSLTY